MKTRRLLTGFILVNLALLTAVGLLMLREPLNERNALAATLRLQAHRLALKEQRLNAYADNRAQLAAWDEADTDSLIIPYDLIAGALADVVALGRTYGLTETAFYTGALVSRFTDADQTTVYEARTSAAYEGAYADLCQFLHALAASDTYYRIERITLEADTVTDGFGYLQMDFSVFGYGFDEGGGA